MWLRKSYRHWLLFCWTLVLVACGTGGIPVSTQTVVPVQPQQPLPINAVNNAVALADFNAVRNQIETTGFQLKVGSQPDWYGVQLKNADITSSVGIVARGNTVYTVTYQLRTFGGLPLKDGIQPEDWKVVAPQELLKTYGRPSQLRAVALLTGGGLVGGTMLIWEQPNVAVLYTLSMYDIAFVQTEYPLCVLPTNVVEVQIWMTESKVIEFVQQQGQARFGKPFSATMFVNATTLDEVRDVLLRDECLRTKPQFWGYDPK